MNPYHDPRWPPLRLAILQRDHHQCRIQLPKCKTKANHVDHIIDWRDDPTRAFDPTNLRAACGSCNVAQRNHRVNARARAQRLGIPYPTPQPEPATTSRDW